MSNENIKTPAQPEQKLPRDRELAPAGTPANGWIDATPQADLPAQVVIMDKELGERHPGKAFSLRVQIEKNVDVVALDGAVTPLDARRIAQDKGYSPTHWMQVGEARPTRYF